MTVQHLLLKTSERNGPQQSVRGDPVGKGSLNLRASSRVSGLADNSSKQGSRGAAHECLVVEQLSVRWTSLEYVEGGTKSTNFRAKGLQVQVF